MRLLQISIVVIKSFRNKETTLLIELFPNFVDDVHMEVDGDRISFLFHLLLQVLHHLIADPEPPIRLQHSKSENVGMFLPLVVFHSDRIGSNNDIIVKTELGQLGVLHCDLNVERSAVFDGEGLEVHFPEHVDVLVVDIPEGNFDSSFFVHRFNLYHWFE